VGPSVGDIEMLGGMDGIFNGALDGDKEGLSEGARLGSE